jgi:hypothetical protein
MADDPTNIDPEDKQLLISYHQLRKAIGVIGVALPFALLIGEIIVVKLFENALGPQPSMSEYYYTAMRGVFVGSLCAIGVFLGSYRGHDVWDRVLATIGCITAVGVAMFPCGNVDFSKEATWQKAFTVTHFTCAGILFVVLGLFCVWLFRRFTDDGSPLPVGVEPTQDKKRKNRLYLLCGCAIFASIAAIGAWKFYCHLFVTLADREYYDSLPIVYFCELVMVEAFGISWLVKGIQTKAPPTVAISTEELPGQ